MDPTTIAVIAVVVVVLILIILSCVRVIRVGCVAVVSRLGKFHKKLEPGFHIIMPFIDKVQCMTIEKFEAEYGDNH